MIFIRGARQVGKTTLVRDLLPAQVPARYVTLDNAAMLSAAQADPAGFLAGLGGPAIIDEAQKAPGLFPAIKELVDRDRTPGRFILTGSANVMAGLRVSDSLAGRMEIFTLWPLARGEIAGAGGANFVDALFADGAPRWDAAPADAGREMLRAVCAGGYPEALGRTSPRRRQAWFEAYVATILERDVRDLANIQDRGAMSRLFRLLATRTAQLLSYADISRDLGLPQTTLKRYMALFEATFLTWELPAWSRNMGKRLAKAPKLMFTDTGLAASLLGLDEGRLAADRGRLGSLLENYVAAEVAKQAAWAGQRVTLHHFRSYAGEEADLVLEDPAGRVVGIEVKATATPRAEDFKGVKALAEACGDRFLQGVVLHLGSEAIPFGKNLVAAPATCL